MGVEFPPPGPPEGFNALMQFTVIMLALYMLILITKENLNVDF